jgi:N-acetylmuramic acid 6-phosphate etherase
MGFERCFTSVSAIDQLPVKAKKRRTRAGVTQISSTKLSPTEARNVRSMQLDSMPLRNAIQLMLSEEAKVPRCVAAKTAQIDAAIRLIVKALRRGGRLFYAGAGTSGRLGVMDASEIPPTFGSPPRLVEGVIAGGHSALWRSVEGAEDDSRAGAREMKRRKVAANDAVVGIAASGTTPFVWGALLEAKRRHAATILISFNPHLRIARADRPKVMICPEVGPEVLTGSTRLKAGTATKLILNLLSTLSMVRLGKVMSNMMVDLNPANTKLRGRAIRIVRELAQADRSEARAALEANGWNVRKAVADLV